MKNILDNITKFRKEKGLSYENIAQCLDLSPAAYRKIELCQTHLTVERLYQISEVLKVTIAKLLSIEQEQYNQTNKDQATGYLQKIENFYQENKEIYEKLAESQKETIASQAKTILAEQGSIEALKALVASLQAQLAELKNKS